MPYADDDDDPDSGHYSPGCTPTEERLDDLEAFTHEATAAMAKLLAYLFGSSLAMVISYSNNHSILWGIGHGLLSWAYVIYYAIFK